MLESWAQNSGITGKGGGLPDWVGGLVLIQRAGLECGHLGGLTAVVPVTQMLHGRGLLL